MTRILLQLPDSLYGQAKRYADCREISMAEFFRNAIEMFVQVHAAEICANERTSKWSPPVCTRRGLKCDPFADEDWRERLAFTLGESVGCGLSFGKIGKE